MTLRVLLILSVLSLSVSGCSKKFSEENDEGGRSYSCAAWGYCDDEEGGAAGGSGRRGTDDLSHGHDGGD